MTRHLTVKLCQIGPQVGDIRGNMARMLEIRAKAAEEKVDLVIFPEMAVTGYPPEDLILRPRFQQKALLALDQLAAATEDGKTAILTGGLWREQDKNYNAAILMEGGRIVAVQKKHHLPDYGVFDDPRIFASGQLSGPVEFRGVKLGLLICEDIWYEAPVRALAKEGAEAIIVMNASPYEAGKRERRLRVVTNAVLAAGRPVLYLNQIGGQDELVFDGNSFALSAEGDLLAELPSFEESSALLTLFKEGGKLQISRGEVAPPLSPFARDYQAMVLGLRDYVEKNRFPGVLLGLSGGIDSALTAVVAVDALGKDRVRALMLPSPFTGTESFEDAAIVAKNLGIALDTIPITSVFEQAKTSLAPLFAGRKPDVTEENLQSRIRGLLLMAVSNKENLMLLTTGNKSELAMGYATLYGDMCGGFSVLKDVYKTRVYELSGWRNQHLPKGALGPEGGVIPPRVFEKAPSAELKPDQRDDDTLPPYNLLDRILEGLIEEQRGISEVAGKGFELEMVEKVAGMLARSEYKRRQAPPGVKLTAMSFGRDRRYPITSGYRDHRS